MLWEVKDNAHAPGVTIIVSGHFDLKYKKMSHFSKQHTFETYLSYNLAKQAGRVGSIGLWVKNGLF